MGKKAGKGIQQNREAMRKAEQKKQEMAKLRAAQELKNKEAANDQDTIGSNTADEQHGASSAKLTASAEHVLSSTMTSKDAISHAAALIGNAPFVAQLKVMQDGDLLEFIKTKASGLTEVEHGILSSELDQRKPETRTLADGYLTLATIPTHAPGISDSASCAVSQGTPKVVHQGPPADESLPQNISATPVVQGPPIEEPVVTPTVVPEPGPSPDQLGENQGQSGPEGAQTVSSPHAVASDIQGAAPQLSTPLQHTMLSTGPHTQGEVGGTAAPANTLGNGSVQGDAAGPEANVAVAQTTDTCGNAAAGNTGGSLAGGEDTTGAAIDQASAVPNVEPPQEFSIATPDLGLDPTLADLLKELDLDLDKQDPIEGTSDPQGDRVDKALYDAACTQLENAQKEIAGLQQAVAKEQTAREEASSKLEGLQEEVKAKTASEVELRQKVVQLTAANAKIGEDLTKAIAKLQTQDTAMKKAETVAQTELKVIKEKGKKELDKALLEKKAALDAQGIAEKKASGLEKTSSNATQAYDQIYAAFTNFRSTTQARFDELKAKYQMTKEDLNTAKEQIVRLTDAAAVSQALATNTLENSFAQGVAPPRKNPGVASGQASSSGGGFSFKRREDGGPDETQTRPTEPSSSSAATTQADQGSAQAKRFQFKPRA